jgi:ABC-2 type transport system ATP-binding protein
MTENSIAISVEGLVKDYPGLRAVDGISFNIRQGEIFGVVGPNGAGKTTTIECIEGLRKPDGGSIEVLGHNAITEQRKLREIIGVQLQTTALYDHMKVREALKLFASLYSKKIDWGKDYEKLMGPLDLNDKIDSFYQGLSGGQKQRLHIALAMVHDPEVIFLDELTTGLDPQARRKMWDLLRSIREKGKTIFLTTHYMEEAEYLCDRVAIFDQGKIIALDSPSGLISSLGGNNRILFSIPDGTTESEFSKFDHVSRVERLDGRYILYSSESSKVLMELIKNAEAQNWTLDDLHVQKANLEDVFLSLTGKELRE